MGERYNKLRILAKCRAGICLKTPQKNPPTPRTKNELEILILGQQDRLKSNKQNLKKCRNKTSVASKILVLTALIGSCFKSKICFLGIFKFC